MAVDNAQVVPQVLDGSVRLDGHTIMRRAIVVGLMAGVAHLLLQVLTRSEYPGDFVWALSTAFALTHGIDPYGFTPNPELIPYPLPVALFGLPFVGLVGVLPLYFPSGVFIGVSAGLLTWSMLKNGDNWRLATILLSGPFLVAVVISQWSPLIVASWYLPALAPLLVLVKPQIALPVAAARMPSRLGLLIAAVVLLASLIIDATWPFRFLSKVGQYQSAIPILTLPFGPLLVLSALRWRDERARLLLLMALMPQRTIYDFLALWLVPTRRPVALMLTGLSWIVLATGLPTWPAMLSTPDMRWAIQIIYIPLLAMVMLRKN